VDDTENPADISTLHAQSAELWLQGDREEAIRLYRQAVESQSDAICLHLRDNLPKSFDDPAAKPIDYVNLSQQRAFRAYRDTAAMRVDDSHAWFNVGVELEAAGKPDEAMKAFTESFQVFHRNRGTQLVRGQQTEEAIAACLKAVQIDSSDAKAWMNLGAAYGQAGMGEEEVESYRTAIGLAPKYAEAWYNLGVAHARQEEDAEAIQAYRRALVLLPRFARAWFNLGVLLGKLGNWREKVKAYRKAVEADPNFGEAWYNLGAALSAQGRTEEANRALLRARKLLHLEETEPPEG